jgi:hypothetical protein
MNRIDPVRVRIARVWRLAAHRLQVDCIRSHDLSCYRHLGGLDCAKIVSSAVGKIPIRRAKVVEFSPFLVNGVSSADIDEEGDSDNKPGIFSVIRFPERRITYQTGP